MASYYAELHLAGSAFPVLRCSYAFHQDTDAYGRASAKVRHGLLHLVLDVPLDDEALLDWAAAVHKPLAGQVVFYDDQRARVARESIRFAAGQCVAYDEVFESGDTGTGAYTCALAIAAPAFELHAGGGPAAVVAAAATSVTSLVTAAVPAAAAVAAIGGAIGAARSTVTGVASAAAVGDPTAVLAAAATVALPKSTRMPEYTRKQFIATMKGAEHVRPKSVLRKIYDLFNAASVASAPGKPSIPDWKKVEALVCSTYYNDPDDHNKKKPLNGHWPPANGGYQHRAVQLKKGDVFDRYQGGVFNKKEDPVTKDKVDLEVGDEFNVTVGGEFLSPMCQAGTPLSPQSFASRALNQAEDKYPFAYTVNILEDVPFDVVQGELAEVIPWYGQPGGGTQMRLTFPAQYPAGEPWKYREWEKMQQKGYAEINLKSSPNGKYSVLPGNRAKKIS